MRVVIIVQARMNSTRLPGKVLLPVAGKSILLRQIERIKFSKQYDEVVVATTTDISDNIIAGMCEIEGIPYYRGHPYDLLDRHYKAGKLYNADVIVKIPSDCPLIDPKVIDKVITFYKNHSREYDFVSNLHPPSYPDGNDVEIVPMRVLEYAHRNATKQYEREHTTPFIWDNPEIFRIGNCTWETGYNYSMSHRWTLDYDEDYHFIREVYKKLYAKNPQFSLYDVLSLLEEKPEIAELNRKYIGVNWYGKHLNELKSIPASQTRMYIE